MVFDENRKEIKKYKARCRRMEKGKLSEEEEQALKEIAAPAIEISSSFLTAAYKIIFCQEITHYLLFVGCHIYDDFSIKLILEILERVGAVSPISPDGKREVLCLTMKDFYLKMKDHKEDFESICDEIKKKYGLKKSRDRKKKTNKV